MLEHDIIILIILLYSAHGVNASEFKKIPIRSDEESVK